jgi:CubicO group peptidase (beta-lactamase class C family)
VGRALDLVRSWPVNNVAAAVVVDGAMVDHEGPIRRVFRLASISKPIATWAALVAVEEGIVSLDDNVGPATLRHLLTHAAGYGFDGPNPIVSPERKRIYSNTGIERAMQHVAEAAEMPFASYLDEAVLTPLGMVDTVLRGSPAHGVHSSVADVARFIDEVVHPTLVTATTAALATQPHFPELGGIVPGVGRFDACPWGLGFELRGEKSPHWTGEHNSTSTFGHFGGSGTMMWVDPAPRPSVGLVALTDRPFDEWSGDALRLWPQLSDAVLAEFAG